MAAAISRDSGRTRRWKRAAWNNLVSVTLPHFENWMEDA
jgi:hypothetical protein